MEKEKTIEKEKVYTFDIIKSINTRSINLKPHQTIISDFITNPKNKGLIIFHSVGSGKTLTSLYAAKKLLDVYPDKKVYVAVPPSLIGNYRKEIEKFNNKELETNIIINSYLIFIKKVNEGILNPENQILIIDEAHNFNTLYSDRSVEIGKICNKMFKVLLLTATPVKNYPHEIINLLLFISNDTFPKKSAEDEIKALQARDIYGNFINDKHYKYKIYKKYLKCKFSFFKNVDKSSYPSTTEHVIRFKMGYSYYNKYYNIQKHILNNLPDMYKNSKDLTYFINGVRRAINKIDNVSPKIEWAQEKIKEEYRKNRKCLVYSSFKDSGINIIKEYLKSKNMRFSEISGDISKKNRDLEVKRYNENKTKVLLITAAGSEGLDLKETRNVIIIEPYWNPARIEQVIGRAVRYESHKTLPREERHVDIYHLLVSKPMLLPFLRGDKELSADDLLYNMSNSKNELLNDFYYYVEKLSIENDKSCF